MVEDITPAAEPGEFPVVAPETAPAEILLPTELAEDEEFVDADIILAELISGTPPTPTEYIPPIQDDPGLADILQREIDADLL